MDFINLLLHSSGPQPLAVMAAATAVAGMVLHVHPPLVQIELCALECCLRDLNQFADQELGTPAI